MLDAVHHFAVLVHQNDVAVFAHDLDIQRIAAGDAHFILGCNVHANHALQASLIDALHAPAGEVFAQKHAEVKSLIRVGFLLIRQMQARVAA